MEQGAEASVPLPQVVTTDAGAYLVDTPKSSCHLSIDIQNELLSKVFLSPNTLLLKSYNKILYIKENFKMYSIVKCIVNVYLFIRMIIGAGNCKWS